VRNHSLSALVRELKTGRAYVERARSRACAMQETALVKRLDEIVHDIQAEITSLDIRRSGDEAQS
jgi:hypothetical protein